VPDRTGEIKEILDRIGRGESVSHHETVGQRKDGTTFPVSVTYSPIRGYSGRLIGASAIARDITEQQQLREAAVLRRRAADLEQANQYLETFTYSVCHDLRAPLRALSGFSAALLEDCGDALGEDGRGYAERIQAASDQMAELVDNLLNLSRVSRAEVHLQDVDLGAEAAGIAEELQRGEPGRGVHFAIQRPVHVRADRSLIRTVLQNLLGNAWKFTSGRDDASIEFGTTLAGDALVCCYVRDNGAGFDPTYVDKLFIPFQRLHAVSEFPGNGVGLASVRQIVELHGGHARAEGTVGEGATFYFTLDAKESK
jgi:light-regulated signal transduction histidine kinase (bacteriophytochrome)